MNKEYKKQPEKNKNTKIQGEGSFKWQEVKQKIGQFYLQLLRWKENFNHTEFIHYFQKYSARGLNYVYVYITFIFIVYEYIPMNLLCNSGQMTGTGNIKRQLLEEGHTAPLFNQYPKVSNFHIETLVIWNQNTTCHMVEAVCTISWPWWLCSKSLFYLQFSVHYQTE